MPNELHLYTGGQDPFIMDMGDVTLYIHAGGPLHPKPAPLPTEILNLPPLDPTRSLIDVPADVETVRSLLNGVDGEDVAVALAQDSTAAGDQFQRLLGGLYATPREAMRMHVISSHDLDE